MWLCAVCDDGAVSSSSAPRLTLSDRWYVFRRALASFWLGHGLDEGAKLTFFTVLAFAPTVLSVYSLSTLVLANNREVVNQATDSFIESYVMEEYEQLTREVVSMVVGSAAQGWAGLIIAVVISLFSASGYVRALSRTANEAFGVREGRNPVRLLGKMALIMALMVLGIMVILVTVTVNRTVVEAVLIPVAVPLGLEGMVVFLTETFLPVWEWVRWPLTALMVMLLLDVLYHYTANIRLPKFRWISAGAIFAALGLAGVGAGFWVYLRYFTGVSSYGTIGTLLAALFALWGANIVVVLGLFLVVETERLHLLRQGQAAEEEFPLPLRSGRGLQLQRRVQRGLVAEAGRIRLDIEFAPSRRDGAEDR